MNAIGFVVPKPDEFKSTRFGIPIGILYLASVLREAKWRVEVFEKNIDGTDNEVWKNFLEKYRVFGVTIAGYSRKTAQDIVNSIKSYNDKNVVIVGGPDVTLRKEIPMNADFGMIGEGETRIVQLLREISLGESPNTPGVIDQTGKINTLDGWPFLCSPDNLPYPARDLLQKDNETLEKEKHKQATTILTARGCSCQCAFCARPQLSGRQYRPRTTNSVLDELEYLQGENFQTVAIIDDNFLFQRNRVRDIMEGILQRNIRLELSISGWAREKDINLYKLIRKAGVKVISFGLESGIQGILEFYKKPLEVEMAKEAIIACDEAGIFTIGNYIFGAPTETIKDMEETFASICKLPLDNVNLKILGYTHGSQLWNEAYEKGLVNRDEFNILAGSERGLSCEKTSSILEFCRKAGKVFHERPEHKKRLIQKISRWGAPYSLNNCF